MQGRERVLAGVVVLLALVVVGTIGATPASASKGVVAVYDTGESGNVPLKPQDIAVDPVTGALYVADGANYRVVKLEADGSFERAWGWDVDADDPGEGFEICVAPSNCKAGLKGTGPAQFHSVRQIAVDHASDSVFVSSSDQMRIYRFDLDGNPIAEQSVPTDSPNNNAFSLAVKPGPAVNTLLAADGTVKSGGLTPGREIPGALYWMDLSLNTLLAAQPLGSAYRIGADSQGAIYRLEESHATEPHSRVSTLSPTGEKVGEFAVGDLLGHYPRALEVDYVNDRIYLSRYDRAVPSAAQPGAALWEIAEFSPDGELLATHALGVPAVEGLAVHPDTGVIYAATEGKVLVIDEVTDPPVPSITSIVPAGTTATLNGTIDPRGTSFNTTYHWEYRVAGTTAWAAAPVPDVDIGNGSGPVTLEPEQLNGLEPNTDYEVRLVAIRQGGAGSAIVSDEFRTQTVPPVATERSAYPVAATSAQLRGVINPRNSGAQYYFEYGETDDYGLKTQPRSLAAGNADVPVYATLAGLDPETTYHFRLVVDNGTGGEIRTEDVTFATRSTAEMAWPKRGIELANPADTGSQNVTALLDREQDRVVWSTIGGAPGSPTGTVGVFVAERNLATPQGWQSRTILPRVDEMIAEGSATYVLSEATPGYEAVAGYTGDGGRMYFFRYEAGGAQSELADVPFSDLLNNTQAQPQVTPDLQHFFTILQTRLDKAHPIGSSFQIYDLGSGTPRLVSRLVGNGVPTCGVPDEAGPSPTTTGFGASPYPMLAGGGGPGKPVRVFFESAGNDCAGPFDLYRRDDGGTAGEGDDVTRLVSGPQVAGPKQTAHFIRASADGSEVLYVTAARNDAADTNSHADVYAWTEAEGNSCVTCAFSADADVVSRHGGRTVMASDDLRRIYFNSAQQLVPGEGEPGSGENLYYLDRKRPEDGLAYVAQAVADPAVNEMSDDGTLLVFSSTSRDNTPDETGGFNQFFRYEAADGSVECITCPPPGVPAAEVNGLQVTGSVATLAIRELQPRAILSADGNTFAFQSRIAYVPEDINGGPDIYEWRRDGRLRLVTDGVSEFPRGAAGEPTIQGVSADGRNIMFAVAAKLTGFELERTRQVYVARTGGGFDPPPPPPDPCIQDACQGPLQPVPPLAQPGSESLRGAGNPRPPARKQCPRGKVRRGKGCVAKKGAGQCRTVRVKVKGKQKTRVRCQRQGGKSKARGKRGGKGRAK